MSNIKESKDDTYSENKQPQKGNLSISLSAPSLSTFVPTTKQSTSSTQISNAYQELFHARPSYKLLIRDIIKADISIIDKKSFLLCPHRHHCIQNAFMKGFWRTFAAAFIFKTSLSFFAALFGGKLINFKNGTISWKALTKICLSQDSLLFGQIFALMSFTYKLILCALRRYRLKDPIWHKTIAGFICGLWILLDNRKRRNTFAFYCIFRAIADLMRVSVAYGKVPHINHVDVMTFTLAQMINAYAFIKQPKGMDTGYYKWLKYISNFTEKKMQTVFRSSHFVECFPKWHSDSSCLRWNIKESFTLCVKASKMYIPVHFLPTLLLSPKKIFQNPMQFAKRKLWNVMISALFLTVYGLGTRYTICFIRNIIHRDPSWMICFGGFISGLSLFVENANRRSELALYCIPRAMEWMLAQVDKNSFPTIYKVLRTNLLPTFVFQIALAIWLSIWNIPRGIEHSNTSNMTILKIVFGTKH